MICSLGWGTAIFGEVCYDALKVMLLTWMFLDRAEPINQGRDKACLAPRASMVNELWHVTRG
jgi:hypothetical protein